MNFIKNESANGNEWIWILVALVIAAIVILGFWLLYPPFSSSVCGHIPTTWRWKPIIC